MLSFKKVKLIVLYYVFNLLDEIFFRIFIKNFFFQIKEMLKVNIVDARSQNKPKIVLRCVSKIF